MATRLKNLKVKKVDFVDEGANPDAHIKLFKRNDAESKGDSAEKDGDKGASVWKRLLGFIGKAAGLEQKEIDSAMDEIQKGNSVSFNEKLNEARNQKIADEIWDVCYALQSSLYSILYDGDMDSVGMESAMKESLDEFYAVAQDCATKWSDGKEAHIVRKNEEVGEADLEVMKSAVSRMNEVIKKASETDEGPIETNNEINENPKGEEEMRIDKSKLTEAERDFLESIEKRCGIDEAKAEEALTQPTTSGAQDSAPPVAKSMASATEASREQTQTTGNEDIYKGIHPAVKAELEQLKKFREEMEDKELYEVAKKYAIIGKSEDELVPLFKSMKAAGGTAYNDMIAVLDQTVATVEKSGAFGEIGKSGHSAECSTVAKVNGIAKSYMEKDQTLDYQTAIARAWENNPALLAEYEEEENF